MNRQSPALTSNSKFKELLFPQNKIVKMMKRNSFKAVRQLLPLKDIQKTVDKLGLDKRKKKIGFVNLVKAIFYSITVKNNGTSRSISSVGKRKQGKLFSQLPPVSHVAILDRLNNYDEEKVDALLNQISLGIDEATNHNSKITSKVRVLDGSTFSLSFSRTGDELPKVGSGGTGKSSAGSSKSMMKLGLVSTASNFIAINWQFSDDYDDNQIFRDLVDWSKEGYTYVIDRGNVAVDYLKKFADNKIYFIQKTYEKHTFDKLWSKKLPVTSRVLGRFDLKEELRGWILRKDGVKVKVRRILAFDENNKEMISLTTNDLTSPNHVIVKRHTKRWDIEVIFDWLKNTLGPNDDHKLTQWKRLAALRNLIRIWLMLLSLLCAYAKKRFGAKWRVPGRFSLGDVIRFYADQLGRWLEGKLGLRGRHHKSKMGR